MDKDRVERGIVVRAAPRRVWRAISDPRELGTWFGLGEKLELIGEVVPGADLSIEGGGYFCTIERVEPERKLSFRWIPYEVAPGEDRARHATTLVELTLEEVEAGTRLTVTESGFSKLPPDKQYKRDENDLGWKIQVESIAQHVMGGVVVRVEDVVLKPAREVFEAIVDPEKMSQYFISKSSGRMAAGASLVWEWSDVGAKANVEVKQVEPEKKVMFAWSAAGTSTDATPSKVTLTLAAEGDRTRVTAIEAPFALTDEGVKRALGQTQGWTNFICCLKAYLEHGIDLRRSRRVA